MTKPHPNSGEYDARYEAWFFDSLRSVGIDAGEKRLLDTNSGVEGQGDTDDKREGTVDSGLGGSKSIVLETNSSYGLPGSVGRRLVLLRCRI